MQVLTRDPQYVVIDFGAHPWHFAAFDLNQQVALHKVLMVFSVISTLSDERCASAFQIKKKCWGRINW